MSAPALGFTGTQGGMTDEQKFAVEKLVKFIKPAEVHHGDCIGADADFHDIATGLGILVVIHPPEDPKKRAFCQADEFVHPRPYLERNKDIVESSQIMIATPIGFLEEKRSGTWSTIRYARKMKCPVFVVFPNGNVEVPV